MDDDDESDMKEKHYTAYGINMYLSQMTYRCPCAALVVNSGLGNYILHLRGIFVIHLHLLNQIKAKMS